jgi:hypothetical protein
MATKSSREVFLNNLRGKWFTLVEPDIKFNDNGVYGVGAILDDAAAQALNGAISAVAQESDTAGKTYSAGEVVKANMKASGVSKFGPKKGQRWTATPLVYNPDLTPADAETIAELGRKSKFTLKVRVYSYPAIGKQQEDGSWPAGCRAGGISVGFVALQILNIDAGEPSPEEQGFIAAVSTEGEDF